MKVVKAKLDDLNFSWLRSSTVYVFFGASVRANYTTRVESTSVEHELVTVVAVDEHGHLR